MDRDDCSVVEAADESTERLRTDPRVIDCYEEYGAWNGIEVLGRIRYGGKAPERPGSLAIINAADSTDRSVSQHHHVRRVGYGGGECLRYPGAHWAAGDLDARFVLPHPAGCASSEDGAEDLGHAAMVGIGAGIRGGGGWVSEHSQEGALCTPESATRLPTSPREVVCLPMSSQGANGPNGKDRPQALSSWDIVEPPSTQVENMDRARFLKQTPLFSGFSDREIESVLGTAKERGFAAGDSIITEGQEGGRGFYLVLTGSAEARRGETVLAQFGPGDYFGEMALLLEDTPRTADIVATVETSCVVITQWDLGALIKVHPEIGVKMMSELARRLRDTDATLSD